MIKLIEENLKELEEICKVNSVAELFLFGSAASGSFGETSDLDFAVVLDQNLSPLEHGDAFFSLMFALEDLFDRRVDLVSYRVVKNRVFKEELDKTKVTLYAA